MDALVHTTEAFIARVATPLARGLAPEAAPRIGRSLEAVCCEPGNHLHLLANRSADRNEGELTFS